VQHPPKLNFYGTSQQQERQELQKRLEQPIQPELLGVQEPLVPQELLKQLELLEVQTPLEPLELLEAQEPQVQPALLAPVMESLVLLPIQGRQYSELYLGLLALFSLLRSLELEFGILCERSLNSLHIL